MSIPALALAGALFLGAHPAAVLAGDVDPAIPSIPIPTATALSDILASVEATNVWAERPEVAEALAPVVDGAHAQGIDLSVVALAYPAGKDAYLRDIAKAIGDREGGTVLVLAPGQAGTYSDRYERVTLEAGQDTTYATDVVDATAQFVDRLQQPEAPWTAYTVAGLVVMAALVAGVIAIKVRRA